ncbi:nucleoporin Nup157/170 [Hypoxylon sp. EC38]|nr:nucleoporin Nup157/170 [Hypoxylon sp. EC38]
MAFPQTPSHALPGAFLHTPAVASRFNSQQDPVRRRLFRENIAPSAGQLDAPTNPDEEQAMIRGLQGLQSLQSQNMPPQPPLAKAATYINNALARDSEYPQLDSYCRQISSDYDILRSDSPWAPFQQTTTYALPNNVLEQYNKAEVSTMMGLFAELNHAWVTIDNSLYLWDYTHPNPELIGYEDSQHSITAVKLVAPKPDVFNKIITHILVVATTSEMFLLGVAAKDAPSGAKTIELYGTKMSLPLKGTEAHVIAGSADGRIFFSGQSDSDIYELKYQQEEKWFTNRAEKINHTYRPWSAAVPNPSQIIWGKTSSEHIVDIVVDDTRSLLYSLSNTSTVRTYHIEPPNKLTKVIEKTKDDFLRDITHMLSVTSPLLNDRIDIVSISPISVIEDSKVHLMALTNTGCRLFMSATSAASYILNSSNQAPQSMQLQCIKFPPTGQQRSRIDRFSSLIGHADMQSKTLERSRRGIRFAPGYFLDFVTRSDRPEVDCLFMSAPDSGRINHGRQTQSMRFYEHATWIEIGSRAEDIGLVTKPFAASDQPQGFGNELAVQFDDPNGSEFAVLTNTGVHLIRRKRLVDVFALVIRNASGDEGVKAEVNRFRSAYGHVETITAALAVACRQGDNGRAGIGRGIDQTTQDRAKQVYINYGGNPRLPEQDGQPATVEMVQPSTRHAALTLYLSRLIRRLWKSWVIELGVDAGGALTINSVVPIGKLKEVQGNVESLRSFLDANRAFIQGLSGPADLRRAGSKQEELGFQGEHQAMRALETLMMGITEGISFVTTLFEERVTDIFARLDNTSRQQLRELTYEQLFSQDSGKELAKVLVKAIVNRNIENGSNVETVADALRRKCGSFCSPDDVVIFKAQEQLKRASEPSLNPNTSRTLLHESLRLFQKVAKSLTQANLESAIEQYVNLRYYAGAIQLCLVVANEKDRGNSALSWVNDGKPTGDPRAKFFEDRRICYRLIHRVLQELDTASSREPEMIDGKPTLIATKRAEAYDVVSSSSDEVFHFDLYEWYIQQGWTDRLLGIDSPHVTTFLRRLASKDFEHADLLCRFYTMRQQYFDAAKVQADLAQSDFPISIKNRLTLLSKAKTNASVMTTGISRQEQQLLNHEVTELLEVAHIQDDLLERLKVDSRIPPERQLEIQVALDGKIQPLSELFNGYADQAGYYDLCLLIYHVADFRNSTTIAQTWSSLIQQTHENVAEQWSVYDAERRKRGAQAGDPPPQPYEVLVGQIQDICHRSSNDSFIFPVPTLLPEICRYAFENAQDTRIGADVNWPVIVFLNLGVSYDLVMRVLEQMFEAQEVPFRGAGRARIIEWIIYVAGQWVRELSRNARSEARLDPWVSDLVVECERWLGANSLSNNAGGADIWDLVGRVAELRRAVEGLVFSPVSNRSMGFY